jgi:cytochrome c551/c552
MKRIAVVLAIIAMAGCKKGEQPSSSATVPDTSSQMMVPDTSHKMMMADTSHPMVMADTSHMMMSADTSHMMMSAATSAKAGATIYKNKGCAACHNIAKSGETAHRRPGGKQSGPDLGGVTERRDRAWLRRWLKDPDAMRASDPIAIAMVAQAKELKMPNMKLTDTEIEAVINYLAVKQ